MQMASGRLHGLDELSGLKEPDVRQEDERRAFTSRW